MRHTPLALAALAGAMIAWLAASMFADPVIVPDTTGPLVAEVERTRAERERAAAERDSALAVLADSTEAWRAERRRLAVVTIRARATADSLADRLRGVSDPATVRLVDELQEAHAVEVQALTEAIATYEAETAGLRAGMRTASLVITAQRHEIEALHALDAERRSMEDALRAEIRKKTRTHRLTMAVAAGAITLALVGG